MTQQGYYWAYRKGSPIPDIVYVYDGKAYEICHYDSPLPGERGDVALDYEYLAEQKWILGEKVSYSVDMSL